MSSQAKINSFFSFIYPLAVRAGDILLEGYNSIQKGVDIKTDCFDVVTKYDHKIEKFLINEIKLMYPEHKFIGEEETAEKETMSILTDDPTWIIDPIDGTANFIKQIPHTAISIGLVIDKKIVLGIINNPITKMIYTAKSGQGAYRNNVRIHVSDCKNINEAIIGYEVSLLHVPDIREKHIKQIYCIGSNSRRLVSYGTVVESLCYVASGKLDGYIIEDMYPWDCAAGVLLVREAGGFVTNPKGESFDIMKPDLISAGTENLHQQMINLIKKSDLMKFPIDDQKRQ